MNNPYSKAPDPRRTPRDKRYEKARYGRVLRVDYENWEVDLLWEQSNSGVDHVPIPMAFSSPRAMLGGMPEPGSSTLVDFTVGNAMQGSPVMSSYLASGFRAGINQRKQREMNNDFPLWEQPVRRRKWRKLYPGEIIGASTQGSDWLLDENVTLQDMKGDEISINHTDHSINQISLQTYQINDAVKHSSGWIYRPIIERYNEDGSLIVEASTQYTPDVEQGIIVDETGKSRWYRTVNGVKSVDDYWLDGQSDLTSLPLVESRTEVREIGYGSLPLTDQTVDSDEWYQNNVDLKLGNVIESVSGTLVGYDRADSTRYGYVLRPQIFINPDTATPAINEIPVLKGQAPDYTSERYQAAAYMWKMPYKYSQTRMYVSKEGHVHLHVGSTWEAEDSPFEPAMVHPLGSGRSLEAHFAGSIKAVVDKNREREESLDLKTVGKVYFHFGKDDTVPSQDRRGITLDGESDYIGGMVRPSLSLAPKTPQNQLAKYWSVEGVTDGGINLRIGRTHGRNLRQYETNGYTSRGDYRKDTGDVRDSNRALYPIGDKHYRHHDLAIAGEGAPGRFGSDPNDPRSGAPVSNPDAMATSLDAHLVGSAFLRLGRDHDSNSLLLDAAGGAVMALGAESKDNRSITMSLDGGIEAKLGRMSKSGNSIQAVLEGGINLLIRGDNKNRQTNIVMEGNQNFTYKGTYSLDVQGKMYQKTSGDTVQTVGANHNVTVMKNQVVHINGTRAMTIGNVPPQEVAYKLSIQTGKKETMIEVSGNIEERTRVGDIILETLKGDAKFLAQFGDIMLAALKGKIDIQSRDIKCGAPFTPKDGVMIANVTPCIAMGVPHFLGPYSLTTKADYI